MLRTRSDRMKFIIPAVMGAVIGYITNWLAIKMLFRPHNEVRVLGIKVPFTPGLIPKERNRIAKSIGDAVGTHLLNPETLAEALCGERVRQQVGNWVRIKIKEIRDKNTSIKELVMFLAGEKYGEFILWLKEASSDMIYRYFKSTEGREAVSGIIKKQVEKSIDNALKKGETISKSISGYIKNFAASEGAKNAVEELLSSRIKGLEDENSTLRSIIPEEAIDALKDHIYQNDSSIAQAIGDVIRTPSMKNRIEGAVGDFIEQNLGRLVTMFIKPEFLSEKFIEGILKYLDNQENHIDIALTTANLFDKLLDKRVSELLRGLSPEIKDMGSREASKAVLQFVGDESNHGILFREIGGVIENSKDSMYYGISKYIDAALEEIIESDEFMKDINEALGSIIDKIMDSSAASILSGIEDKNVDAVVKVVGDNFREAIKDKAQDIVEIADIPGIVEDRIRGFDAAFVEDIIIDISRKELSAITWLGALLGGIIGVITPVIQLLTK